MVVLIGKLLETIISGWHHLWTILYVWPIETVIFWVRDRSAVFTVSCCQLEHMFGVHARACASRTHGTWRKTLRIQIQQEECHWNMYLGKTWYIFLHAHNWMTWLDEWLWIGLCMSCLKLQWFPTRSDLLFSSFFVCPHAWSSFTQTCREHVSILGPIIGVE